MVWVFYALIIWAALFSQNSYLNPYSPHLGIDVEHPSMIVSSLLLLFGGNISFSRCCMLPSMLEWSHAFVWGRLFKAPSLKDVWLIRGSLVVLHGIWYEIYTTLIQCMTIATLIPIEHTKNETLLHIRHGRSSSWLSTPFKMTLQHPLLQRRVYSLYVQCEYVLKYCLEPWLCS